MIVKMKDFYKTVLKTRNLGLSMQVRILIW